MTTTGADWLDQARRLMETLRDATAQGTTAQGTTAQGATAQGATAQDPPAAADPGPAASPADPGPAGGDCRWCPLCQAAAMVRGERPELSAALADILATTAAALRSFAGPAAAPAQESTAPDPGEQEASGAAGRPVQRIELS
jgi:hypothetical protein